MILHGEQRPLIAWLIMQEKVLRMWISELAFFEPTYEEALGKLEAHRAWLSSLIEELEGKQASVRTDATSSTVKPNRSAL